MLENNSMEKVIREHRVVIHPFTGSRANKMFVRLQQCFAPPYTIICTPDTWQQFCLEFLAFTFVNDREIGQQANFDTFFMGNLSLLFEIILAVSEVNFGKDFLSRGGSIGDITQPELPRTSE